MNLLIANMNNQKANSLSSRHSALFAQAPSSYHSGFPTQPKLKMRATLLVTLLLSTLLAACASTKDNLPSKHISQGGPLKVHPGLLGQPAPTPAEPKVAPPPPSPSTAAPSANTTAARSDAPIKMDQTGLRTQRSVYFAYNSADLKAEHDPALLAHARYLATNPEARVRIEGNADERGGSEFNRRLGLKRAETVRITMINHGAPARQLSIKTLGDSQPKLKGHDEESWAENRRADVVYEKES
jgi:peptidoglycan-associated lipoprotein